MKYFFFLLIIPFLITQAQTDSLIYSDAKNFVVAGADFYMSPLRFDSNGWLKFSAIIGFTGLATLADKDIKNFSQRNLNTATKDISSIDKYYYIEFVGGSIVAFYVYGLIDNNHKVRNFAVKLAEATAFATSLTLITKTIIGRARPYKKENQYYTNPFTFDNDYNSFPSGHTTLAFAYSTVMANEVDNIFWKIGWYSLAGLVGYARVNHNQHWFSDVIIGGAIGYFSGEFVNSYNSSEIAKSNISLSPIPGGVSIQVIF